MEEKFSVIVSEVRILETGWTLVLRLQRSARIELVESGQRSDLRERELNCTLWPMKSSRLLRCPFWLARKTGYTPLALLEASVTRSRMVPTKHSKVQPTYILACRRSHCRAGRARTSVEW